MALQSPSSPAFNRWRRLEPKSSHISVTIVLSSGAPYAAARPTTGAGGVGAHCGQRAPCAHHHIHDGVGALSGCELDLRGSPGPAMPLQPALSGRSMLTVTFLACQATHPM